MKPVQVQARWKREGRFEPSQFLWNNKIYRVESTGRSWEDASGMHILCMVEGGKVFELVFRLSPAGWFLQPRSEDAEKA